MEIFNNKKALIDHIKELKARNCTIGFVPTMGALHLGHTSLVLQALKTTDYVVVSIFVNPTQFDNKVDLEQYPRTLDEDLLILDNLGDENVIVFTPSAFEIYGHKVTSEQFNFFGLEQQMEGAFRKGHFDGVGTIVKRLFGIVQPDVAFFGEKDFQQLQIIRRLVELEQIPVTVIGCPILRHEDGLAMSSRNERLSENHRRIAPIIFKTLKHVREKFGTDSVKTITEWVETQFEIQELLKLEYFVIADSETLKPIKQKLPNKVYRAFIAVYAGDIRLIDNIALN